MASTATKYTRYLRKIHAKNARSAWPPDGPALRPGDYGIANDSLFRNGPFEKLGNIANDFGVNVEITEDAPSSFSLETSSSVDTSLKVDSPIPTTPPISAGVTIGLSGSGTAIIQGDGATVPQIANLLEIEQALRSLEKEGRWKMDYLLVTQVRHLPNAFIAISHSQKVELGLRLSGNVIPALSDLGKASFDAKVVSERGSTFKAVDAEDVTPIVYTRRLKRPFFGGGLRSVENLQLLEDDDGFAEGGDELEFGGAAMEAAQAQAMTHEQPGELPLEFVETLPMTLAAEESADEPDESLAPEGSAFTAPEVNVLGTYRSDFEAFIRALGLRHFAPHEFLTLGGAHYGQGSCGGLNSVPPRSLWNNFTDTARVLDLLRERLGSPIRISSTYRNPRYNTCIGGASASQHMRFNAADFTCANVTPQEVTRVLIQLRNQDVFRGGIGVYRSFVHVDTRGNNATWAGRGATLQGLI